MFKKSCPEKIHRPAILLKKACEFFVNTKIFGTFPNIFFTKHIQANASNHFYWLEAKFGKYKIKKAGFFLLSIFCPIIC